MQPGMLIMLLRAQCCVELRERNESRITNYIANSLLYVTPEIHGENVAETSIAKVPWNSTKTELSSHEDNVCQQYLFMWNVFG